ncbi:MAG: YceI family protein [Bryobacterales bacterium]|nr:YceI family protein [Bryobacterales bacterium]
MKHAGVSILLLAAIVWGLAGQTALFRVTPEPAAKFELIVKKTGFLSGKAHLFNFPRYEGQLDFDESAPERSKITLRIDAASIECKDDWVSENDRKKVLEEARENMLRVARHKDLLFESQSVRKRSDGAFDVQGGLTIRGIVKPVVVKVTMKPAADGTLAFTGESAIDMTAWGLKPPKALLGAIGTEKEMQVRFALTAKR